MIRLEILALIIGYVRVSLGLTDGLRLVEGDTPFDGRVEVYMRGGWSLMCDRYLHITVAKTICKQLNYPVTNVTLKNTALTDWDRWLRCSDDDTDIFNGCGWTIWPEYVCTPEESLGISCNGNVRLQNGTNTMNGNIETYQDGEMITLCDHAADSRIADVVCRQLGLLTKTSTVVTGSYFGKGKLPRYYAVCNGDESSLDKCRLPGVSRLTVCDSNHVLGIDCNATAIDVEYVDDTTVPTYGGPVNILTQDIAGYWVEDLTKTQSSQQIQNIGSVICYQLGYSRNFRASLTLSIGSQRFKDFVFPIAISKWLSCTGNEASLSKCVILRDMSSVERTDNSTEIAVSCLASIQLVNDDISDTYPASGILVIQNDTRSKVYPLADVYMDYTTAKVACFKLGFNNSNVEIKLVPSSDGQFESTVRTEFVCNGREKQLRDCQSKPNSEVKSDAVVWLNCNYEDPFNTIIQGTAPPRLYAKRGNGEEILTFCTTQPEFDNTFTAGVICHQNGFSRYGAKFIENEDSRKRPANQTGSIFEDISRFACYGMENNIHECPKYGHEPNLEQCLYEVNILCQDTRNCQDRPIDVPKREILCHTCNDLACFNNYNLNVTCSLDEGYACNLEKTYERILGVSSFQPTVTLAECTKSCVPNHSNSMYYRGFGICCYENYCNDNKKDVQLSGNYRLINSVLDSEGLVQVYSDSTSQWMDVKDDINLSQQALVDLCAVIGYTHTQHVARVPDQFTEPYKKYDCFRLNPDICNVNISHPDCFTTQDTCSVGQRLRLSCNAHSSVRVQDGGADYKGRVEVFLNNQWGTVCNKRLSDNIAVVICRSLGFHGSCNLNAPTSKQFKFRHGEGPIHFTDISCKGTESHILQCSYNIVNTSSDCSHDDDFGVVCETNYQSYYQLRSPPNVTEPISLPNTDRSLNGNSLDLNENSRCFLGSCDSANDCNQNLTKRQNLCTLYNDTFCFVEVKLNGEPTKRSVNFGCSSTCIAGSQTIDRSGPVPIPVKQLCCEKPLCNGKELISKALEIETENITMATNGSDVNGTMSDSITSNGSDRSSLILQNCMYFIILCSVIVSI